jgi:Tfp pilus assembly protein PilN
MSDRFVVIAVTLLTLLVMCGLLLAALVWVPSRIDRLEKRLDGLEDLSAKISILHGLLDDLGKIEKKISETPQDTSPLARIDSSIDETSKLLKETVVPGLNDVKGKMIARADIDRLTALLAQIGQKLDAAPQSDPDTKKIVKDVEEMKGLLDSIRKSVDASSRDVARDLKQLNLELQKLTAQLQKSAAASP